MKITADDLQRAYACTDGLALFRGLFPNGYDGEWTLAHQCAVLWHPKARRYLGWLWRQGIAPLWSMRGLHAPRADLSGADLSGANLRWADLSGANLSGANLSGANLQWADLGDWERGPDGMAWRNALAAELAAMRGERAAEGGEDV